MNDNIYFIGAHPDDLIGSAAAAFLFKAQGFAVHVVDYTRGERGLRAQGVPMDECARIRIAEEENACGLLGVQPIFLPEIDGEAYVARETVAALKALFVAAPPRAIFVHWPVDVHPDHVQCHAAVVAAMRDARMAPEVYFFEESKQTRSMPVIYYVPFGQDIMDKKLALCRCYACQNTNDRIAQRKLAEAQYHGWKAGYPYAECFGCARPIVPQTTSVLDALPLPKA